MDSQEYVTYKHLRLPPENLRWGGPRYKDNEVYVKSAMTNISSISQLCSLSSESRILDIGCGPGRLLTGLLVTYDSVNQYVGLDVNRPVIEWASHNLADPSKNIFFKWINALNERYNLVGQSIDDKFTLPVESDHFDLVVLISVFSHMKLSDIKRYLSEIRRVLSINGRVYLSLFVEYGCPDELENPEDYYRTWSGPLHCVRINRHVFERMVYECGLIVNYFKYRHTNDGQSTYVLSRADQPEFHAKVIRD